jgi:uncharacterized protein
MQRRNFRDCRIREDSAIKLSGFFCLSIEPKVGGDGGHKGSIADSYPMTFSLTVSFFAGYTCLMHTELTKEQCEQLLLSQQYGHLGCWDGHEPYVIPITYVYEDGFIYGYTHEGRKIDAMRKHPRVCVQVEKVKGRSDWDSVICCGNFEEVTDADNIQRIKMLLAEEHGKEVVEEGKDIVSPMVEHLNDDASPKSVIYRIRPDKMTGVAEKA